MNTIRFIDQELSEKLKVLFTVLTVPFEEAEDKTLSVDNAYSTLFDDAVCCVRSTVFPETGWYTLSPPESNPQEVNDAMNKKLLQYLSSNQITFIEEYENDIYAISVSADFELPDEIYVND